MAEPSGKPRLLVVTSTYPRWPGDTEPSFVHQLAARLTDRFEVVVSTSHAPGARTSETINDVLVLRYRYAPSSLESLVYGGGLISNLRSAPWKVVLLPTYMAAWVWHVFQLSRSQHFDAMHIHWFVPGALVAIIAKGHVPACITAHGSDVLGLKGSAWSFLRRFIARRARTVTAVGKSVDDALHSEGIQDTQLLPMGVDLTNTFIPPTDEARSPRLLYVGRLVSSKKPELALQVLAAALNDAPGLGLGLDIVGDGPERSRLELISRKLGIESLVTFRGRMDHRGLATMYQRAAALIAPSGGRDAPEGLGLAAVEALGCGCTVVSAPNPALQAAVPTTAPIVFAADDSAQEISRSLRIALKLLLPRPIVNSEWHRQLIEQFDWANVAHAYGDVIQRLVTPPPLPSSIGKGKPQ